jgi:uncharacterized lipoprotein YbaY
MDRVKVVVEGKIVLGAAMKLDRALVEVRLLRAPLADAPATTVASARQPCSGEQVREIAFRLAAEVEPDLDYVLAAEVRRRGGGRLEPGDLLTVESYGWRYGDGRAKLKVRPVD